LDVVLAAAFKFSSWGVLLEEAHVAVVELGFEAGVDPVKFVDHAHVDVLELTEQFSVFFERDWIS